MSKKHIGSSIDDFLKEEGIFEEAQAQAVKEVVARQLAEAMKKKKISKNRMATLLKTSRSQVDRLLDAKDDITLSSLQRAAAIVGRRVSIELVQRLAGLFWVGLFVRETKPHVRYWLQNGAARGGCRPPISGLQLVRNKGRFGYDRP